MGLLQGKVVDDEFVVLDCFRLPVEGTETRVNAGEAANEYMIQYTELNELTTFSNDLVIGWYHSHPGYGCWLSGIDVDTQSLYQEHQDPFLAIVIDPLKTRENGQIEIGAFRTGKAVSGKNAVGASIPKDRITEFGAHCDKYYQLPIELSCTTSEHKRILSILQRNWVDILTLKPGRISCLNNLERSAPDVKVSGTCTCDSMYVKAQRLVHLLSKR